MNPETLSLMKTRCDDLDNKISNQINDFIPERMQDNRQLYTKYITMIVYKWLENNVEDIKFK